MAKWKSGTPSGFMSPRPGSALSAFFTAADALAKSICPAYLAFSAAIILIVFSAANSGG